MEKLSHSEELQKRRYARHHSRVEKHYTNPYSLVYRSRFIDAPLGEGIDWKNARVLEAMCSGGYTTAYLLGQGANVIGLDISPELMETFREKWPACEAVCASILDTGFPDSHFDAVVVMGGLHHVHPHLQKALEEIHRILKPGGYFCFAEPHAGSVPDIARKIWYKLDSRFERNEASVKLSGMERANGDRFEFVRRGYYGNLGYLLVFSERIFPIPHVVKRFFVQPLMAWDALFHRFAGRLFSCYTVCQWRKR